MKELANMEATPCYCREVTLLIILTLGGETIAPEISSVLTATIKVDEAQLVEGANPTKKLESNSVDLVSGKESTMNSLSEELSAFESQMKFFEIFDLEGNWDVSVDTFLNDITNSGWWEPGGSLDVW